VYSVPASTTTAHRGFRWISIKRCERTSECSHMHCPSHANQSGDTAALLEPAVTCCRHGE
jgi:hypothetical protein